MNNYPSHHTDFESDFTVFSLNQKIRDLVEMVFPYPVWLRGEIASTPRVNTRGHIYFQLVETSPDNKRPVASIDCALFAGKRTRIERKFSKAGFSLEILEGQTIRILGKPDIWSQAGRYQFIIDDIDPEWTQGELIQQLRKLVKQLAEEGILELNKSLSMSALPLNVGLITSPESAAYRDFTKTLDESGFPFCVYVTYSSMQGKYTADEVVVCFDKLRSIKGINVVVITRGGGSSTDLAWFNDEKIARVISSAPWPVISGIGHEIDTTLPDFVSHTRAKTPTHAASILADAVSEFAGNIDIAARSLCSLIRPKLDMAFSMISHHAAMLQKSVNFQNRKKNSDLNSGISLLSSATSQKIFSSKKSISFQIDSLKQAVEASSLRFAEILLRELAVKLTVFTANRLEFEKIRIDSIDMFLKAKNPDLLMKSGWSIVFDNNGQLLKSINNTSPGSDLLIRVSDGSVEATTKRISPELKE